MSESKTDRAYARLGRRFLALMIDIALLSCVFFPVTRIVKGVWLMSAQDHAWGWGWIVTDPLCMIFLGAIVVYFVLLEGLAGATVGKWCLKLQVIQLSGGKPGLRRAFLRNILRAVDALPALNILGVILITVSSERTRVGDLVANTRVIVRP
jgi:uncharacterized RDD family membrane protein YckC